MTHVQSYNTIEMWYNHINKFMMSSPQFQHRFAHKEHSTAWWMMCTGRPSWIKSSQWHFTLRSCSSKFFKKSCSSPIRSSSSAQKIRSISQIFPTGWWFQHTPLKSMSSSVGSMIPIWKNRIHVLKHQPDKTSRWLCPWGFSDFPAKWWLGPSFDIAAKHAIWSSWYFFFVKPAIHQNEQASRNSKPSVSWCKLRYFLGCITVTRPGKRLHFANLKHIEAMAQSK